MSAFLKLRRDDMAAALAAVTDAIEKRNTIPILSNVLVVPDGPEAIKLRATNLDIEVTAPCPKAEAADNFTPNFDSYEPFCGPAIVSARVISIC